MLTHRNTLLLRLVLVPLLAFPVSLSADEPKADPFAKWEQEIAALEARDAKEKPTPGGILFVGSSTIRMWDLKQSFPELAAVNHGFGGSQLVDLVHFFDRLVIPLKPKLVVVYEGDNDLASGKKPAEYLADAQALVKRMHEALPDAQLVILAIKPSPSRWKLYEAQREANRLVAEFVRDNPRVKFLDGTAGLLDGSGVVRADFFRDDKLHLNPAGYAVLEKELRPLIAESIAHR